MADEIKKEDLHVTETLLTSSEQELYMPRDFTSPEELYRELVELVLKYHPSDDLSMIEKAYNIAKSQHKDQRRKSGEPYIIHPLCVAIILAELELDKETIASGLLHDVVEDTEMTNEDIRREFGEEVEILVDGVTKLGQIGYQADKVEVQAENLRKMFLAMAKDIRVILIKLADRLHNLRTLQYMKPEKQQEKARETMDIYSPIAGRLGISKIKTEMDDLSLRYLKPDVYFTLVQQVDARKTQRQAFVDNIVLECRERLEEVGIKHYEVKGRVKHYFSIYKKMVNQNKTIDQIYDLFAVRIIVDTVPECYGALGLIHDMYTPMPGRFKDYIAIPKPNMYQSLHSTMIGPGGTPFEIQIRTFEMHRTAEYGIAAHWKYKEASNGIQMSGEKEEEKLAWLRQILEWQQDMSDNHEFMSLLKSDLDLFTDNVYCFSPAGDVKCLPAGSCTVDFAYSIHSAVGNKMVGARVNGKLVPIEYRLRNGDRIEIITSQNARGPSRDWLKIVKSTQAKNKINQWFRKELKEDNIERGKDLITQNIKAKGFTSPDLLKNEYMEAVMQKYGFRDWESVLAAVGHGGLKEGQIVNKLIDIYNKEHVKNITDQEILDAATHTKEKVPLVGRGGKGGIVVEGLHDLAVHFAKCCSPIPGDEIIGFVTRGRGVTVHRTDCALLDRPCVSSLFESAAGSGSCPGLSRRLRNKREEDHSRIGSLSSRANKQGTATLEMSFQVHSKDELGAVIAQIRKIPSVIDVTRKIG